MKHDSPMPDQQPAPPGDMDQAHLLLIVVGAHLRAEIVDRPLGYLLRDRIVHWLNTRDAEINIPLLPVVCSDIWYVNQRELQQRPTISLGGPRVNALSAYYANKLSPALVLDDQLLVQLDPEFVDLRVGVWGMNNDLTAGALDLFTNKYLDAFLRAAVTQVEPHDDVEIA